MTKMFVDRDQPKCLLTEINWPKCLLTEINWPKEDEDLVSEMARLRQDPTYIQVRLNPWGFLSFKILTNPHLKNKASTRPHLYPGAVQSMRPGFPSFKMLTNVHLKNKALTKPHLNPGKLQSMMLRQEPTVRSRLWQRDIFLFCLPFYLIITLFCLWFHLICSLFSFLQQCDHYPFGGSQATGKH